jgi:IS1 family transposase
MLDAVTNDILGWVCGGRDTETGLKIIENFSGEILKIAADHYVAYTKIAGTIPLAQSKSLTVQIERNNARQRHWLACFHRRSQVISRELHSLNARIKLFVHYRVNNSINPLPCPIHYSISSF